MKRLLIFATVAVLAIGAIGTVSANDDHSDRKDAKAKLTGFAEVPAISTTGTGKLRLRIDPTNTTISYELSFSGLEGGAVTGAHLHLGQTGFTPGIGAPSNVIANLCPGACVSPVTGTITAASIVAVPAQGIAGPADWAEVLRAIRAGVVYVNVHTAGYPAGEIRGQVRGGWGGD
jgi:hypothetical protein